MVAKETIEVAEGSLEPALEMGARVARWAGRDYIAVGVIAAVSFAGGALVSHRLTKKKLQREYDVVLEEQIQRTKDYYARFSKKDDYATPQGAAETLNVKVADEALTKYQGRGEDWPRNEVKAEEVVVKNIFADNSEVEFDYEQELSKRAAAPHLPYVITQEEFLENENDYTQQSITYYAGDNTLADERDQPIELVDNVVGDGNLERFGHGSKDKRIVYVRNENLSMDFEIGLHDGKFAHEVLGFQHSEDYGPKIRKFRGDRE